MTPHHAREQHDEHRAEHLQHGGGAGVGERDGHGVRELVDEQRAAEHQEEQLHARLASPYQLEHIAASQHQHAEEEQRGHERAHGRGEHGRDAVMREQMLGARARHAPQPGASKRAGDADPEDAAPCAYWLLSKRLPTRWLAGICCLLVGLLRFRFRHVN